MRSPPPRVHVTDPASRQQALDSLQQHGAVILTNLRPSPSSSPSSWEEVAANLPSLLWDPSQLLLRQHLATAIHEENDQFDLNGKELLPHTDGYIWGDAYPDLVMLLCEQPAAVVVPDDANNSPTTTSENSNNNNNDGANYLIDGANYLIDGQQLLAELEPKVRDLLTRVDVDHTELVSKGGLADGTQCVHPVIRYHKAAKRSRLCWKRMIRYDLTRDKGVDPLSSYISLWTPLPDIPPTKGVAPDNDTTSRAQEVQQALQAIDHEIAQQATIAVKFILQEGEALICDNYRVLHARTAFATTTDHNVTTTTTGAAARRMWRIWSWTEDSKGLPPELKGETMQVAANVLDAASVIQSEQQ